MSSRSALCPWVLGLVANDLSGSRNPGVTAGNSEHLYPQACELKGFPARIMRDLLSDFFSPFYTLGAAVQD